MKGAHQSNLEHTEALGDLSRDKDDLELRLNKEVWVSFSTSVLGAWTVVEQLQAKQELATKLEELSNALRTQQCAHEEMVIYLCPWCLV